MWISIPLRTSCQVPCSVEIPSWSVKEIPATPINRSSTMHLTSTELPGCLLSWETYQNHAWCHAQQGRKLSMPRSPGPETHGRLSRLTSRTCCICFSRSFTSCWTSSSLSWVSCCNFCSSSSRFFLSSWRALISASRSFTCNTQITYVILVTASPVTHKHHLWYYLNLHL